MTIDFEFKDIDGNDIKLGDRVFVFNQNYEIISEDCSDGVPVVLEDHTKPLPLADTPLFVGIVYWCKESSELRINVEQSLASDRGVASFPVHFYDAYQLAANEP